MRAIGQFTIREPLCSRRVIRDFGAGFEVSTTEGRGLGLTSMKERARALRGRLAILSEPQHGTTIHASVPLVQDDPKTPSRSHSV